MKEHKNGQLKIVAFLNPQFCYEKYSYGFGFKMHLFKCVLTFKTQTLPSNFNHVICFLFLDKITIAINGST
jgi:hypothetical protein